MFLTTQTHTHTETIMASGSYNKKQKTLKQRDYVLHDPQLRHLLGTLENYGHQMDDERYERIENLVNDQKEKVRARAILKNHPDPFEEPNFERPRPKTANVTPKREYVLHEPRFRDLQENFLKYYDRPTTANQTKDEKKRRKRLSTAVKDKKEELLEMRMGNIDELKENLEELEEMDVEDMTGPELFEHKQRIASLKARIERELKNVRIDFLPKPVTRPKPYKPETILVWNNPPQYDKNAPHLRQVMEVNEIYGAHMDATRKAILDSTVAHILANKEEYAAWKRQM